MHKRVCTLFFLFALCVGALCVHMLTILEKKGSESASRSNNSVSVTVGETRGYIYDRNLQPLVNRETELTVSVKPTLSALNTADAVLCETVKKDDLYQTVSDRKIAVAKAIAPLQTAEAKTVSKVLRYGQNPTAVHIIGYVNGDGEGVCGIEQYYNEDLKRANGVLKAHCATDAKGRLLDGAELEYTTENYNCSAGVALTLDTRIQEIVEDALQKFQFEKGAVVVLSVENSEILAMVSTPAYDPNNPADALDDADSPFLNRAITAYSVGSVFKAVVAAAALENGQNEDFSYTCTGAYTIGQTTFRCHLHTGHGMQNMPQAMSNSCNPYFIALALEIGAQSVCTMAQNLGLGASIELADGFYTNPGALPTEETLTAPQDLANLAFGQGELLASPLQMTAVYAAIANGGVYRAPSLMYAKVDASKEIYQRAELPSARRVMSEDTAKRVGELLHYAVENGSGKRAKPSTCSAAGKTATAQSGWINDDGTEVTHSWFCGYFPYETPQYAVTVLKENGEGGSVDCAPVFQYIADAIMNLQSSP
ncbi:MAG: peptidoglycan D,D-transpeptidase FtsI family protein [Candidatus Fimenecus sp.]